MINDKNFFKLCLVVVLFCSGCKKDETETDPVDFGYDYYPLAVGAWSEFDVDSIVYDVNLHPEPDTFRYQLREVLASIVVDGEGDTAYRLNVLCV